MLVFSVFASQLVLVPQAAVAATTGSTVEVATVINTIDFVDLEQNEVQSVSNDAVAVNEIQNIAHNHTGGTFTLEFDGQGPTAAINWDDDGSTIKSELELLSNINTVAVTENATGDWGVEFVDPGASDIALTAGDPSLLTGGSTFSITELTKGGGGTFTLTFGGQTTSSLDWNAPAIDVETALDALTSIGDVSVTGVNPWLVTFLDPGAMDVDMMTATDALIGGTGTTTISEETAGLSAPIDPAGVVYLGDNLLVSDSEINEEETIFDDVNLWEMITGVMTTPAPSDVVATGVENAPTREPTGLAYNSANGHVYISNDSAPARVTDVDPGVDGIYGNGDDSITFLQTKPNNCDGDVPFCIDDPEDVAWDPVSGQIFIAGGTGKTLTAVGPGTNGVFDNLPIDGGDDVAGPHIDISAFVTNAEGLGYRESSDTLLLTDAATDTMYELTKDGRLIREIDISELKLPNIPLTPSDVALAPPSDGSPGLHIYMTDRVKDNEAEPTPPRDGKMYELSVPFENLAPWVDAGPNYSIAISDPLSITGDTYDDGQPNPVAPTVTWSQVDGPGTVEFGSPNSLTTTVSFSAIGGSQDPYVLKLTSTDGLLSSEDTMQVQVFADPPVNQPPTVFAGSNQTITLPDMANLSGAVGDDGLPNPPAAVTTGWSKVSGPGSVIFGDASSVVTSASFSTAGVYVLRLTASDSLLQASDDVTVTVQSTVNTFSDDDGNIFEADIEWLASQGITKGCNPPVNDRFCPNENVTRGQMAAFLVRALGYTDSGGGDLFFDDDLSIFENDIDKLGTAGVTKGCNPPANDRFCPDEYVTRGQMAAFLRRALG